MAKVIVDGKEIASFCDDLTECPEDAMWGRDLSTIFFAGVKVGRATKTNDEFEITDLYEPY